jgi:hypothetical protein
MKHSFHPEALEEYLGTVSYYAVISPRLAESFIGAIESGMDEILEEEPNGIQVIL